MKGWFCERADRNALRHFPTVGAAVAYSTGLLALALLIVPPPGVPGVLSHAAASGVQVLFLYRIGVSRFSRLGSAAIAWCAAVAFAGATEWLQYLTPSRTPELEDLLSATVGSGVVVVMILVGRLAVAGCRVAVGDKGHRQQSRDRAEEDSALTKAGGVDDALCLHCRESIQVGARRCPRCQAWQSRWAADSQNPLLELAFLAGGVALVAVVAACLYWLTPRTPQAPPVRSFDARALRAVGVRPVAAGTAERMSLAVVGTLENTTSTAWRDPYLQVECFDRQGSLVEAFGARALYTVIPPGGKGSFKVIETSPLRDPSECARCSVEVRWATRAD